MKSKQWRLINNVRNKRLKSKGRIYYELVMISDTIKAFGISLKKSLKKNQITFGIDWSSDHYKNLKLHSMLKKHASKKGRVKNK